MGEQIEEARIGEAGGFSDLEDDLYDRLSHTTMLATLHTMNEVWPVKETRSVHSDVVGSRPILLRRGPKPLSPLLRLLRRRRMSRKGSQGRSKPYLANPKKNASFYFKSRLIVGSVPGRQALTRSTRRQRNRTTKVVQFKGLINAWFCEMQEPSSPSMIATEKASSSSS